MAISDEINQLHTDLGKYGLSLSSFNISGEVAVEAQPGTKWTASDGSELEKQGPGSYKIRTP